MRRRPAPRLLATSLLAVLALAAPSTAVPTAAVTATSVTSTADGPTAAAPSARQQRVAGGVEIVYRATRDGIQRDLTRQGLAGLPSTPTPTQFREAWIEQGRLFATDAAGESSAAEALHEAHGAPDLDGDGRDDIVDVAMDGTTVSYRGRSGKTGKRLWEFLSPGDYGLVMPARLGGAGEWGLLVTTYAFEESGRPESASFTANLTVSALDPSGLPLWTQAYEGQATASPMSFVYQGLAQPAGLGSLTPSPADDLLVTIQDGAETLASNSGHAQVLVLDGADGSTAASTEVLAAEGWIAAGLVGDLDGDGQSDFATSAAEAAGQIVVEAHRGADASSLWRTTAAEGIVHRLDSAGDTNGDGTVDVLASTFAADTLEGTFAVLSGAHGAMQWAHDGEIAVGVRDVDGDGTADIAVQSVHDNLDSGAFGARYHLLRGTDGTRMYRRTYTLNFDESDGGMGVLGLYGPSGDIDRDGRDDMAHELSISSFDGTASDRGGVVRSRDGVRALRRSPGAPLMARVDRRGDDFVRVDDHRRLLRVRVRDGRTGKRIWQRYLLRPARGSYVTVSSADVVGNRRAEVIVVVPRENGPLIYVLGSGRGRVIWRG